MSPQQIPPLHPRETKILQDEGQQIPGCVSGGKTSAADLARSCRDASVPLPDHPDTISRLRKTWRFLLTPQDGDALGAVVREAYRLYEQRESSEGHVEVGLALRDAERDALSATDRQLWAELCTGRAAHRGICTFVLRGDMCRSFGRRHAL